MRKSWMVLVCGGKIGIGLVCFWVFEEERFIKKFDEMDDE